MQGGGGGCAGPSQLSLLAAGHLWILIKGFRAQPPGKPVRIRIFDILHEDPVVLQTLIRLAKRRGHLQSNRPLSVLCRPFFMSCKRVVWTSGSPSMFLGFYISV